MSQKNLTSSITYRQLRRLVEIAIITGFSFSFFCKAGLMIGPSHHRNPLQSVAVYIFLISPATVLRYTHLIHASIPKRVTPQRSNLFNGVLIPRKAFDIKPTNLLSTDKQRVEETYNI